MGKDVRKQHESDLKLELGAIEILKPGIALCAELGDHTSRELLERILAEEEHHVDWIEAQLHQIQEMGYENYLTLQVHNG